MLRLWAPSMVKVGWPTKIHALPPVNLVTHQSLEKVSQNNKQIRRYPLV